MKFLKLLRFPMVCLVILILGCNTSIHEKAPTQAEFQAMCQASYERHLKSLEQNEILKDLWKEVEQVERNILCPFCGEQLYPNGMGSIIYYKVECPNCRKTHWLTSNPSAIKLWKARDKFFVEAGKKL